MRKLFKWFLYIATTISIFMSIFSLVADETVTKRYDYEAGEEIILSTADCPCWEVANKLNIDIKIEMVVVMYKNPLNSFLISQKYKKT